MAETTIRDVVIRVSVKQNPFKLTVPGATEAAAQAQSVQQSVAGIGPAAASASDTAAKSFKAQQDATAKTTQAYLATGGALKQVGSGTIALARGFAFLTAAKEEDLTKSIQVIAGL